MYSLERREERGRPRSSAKSSSSTPPSAGAPLARSCRSCSLMVDSSSKRNSSSPPSSTPFTRVVDDAAADTNDGDKAADPGDESLLLLQGNFKLSINVHSTFLTTETINCMAACMH